ncbi:hypothetical protein BGT96224_699 [Blumeria graminis f. sp. tritici 96224]|nr:hypothetical protein BGT96224_699 [Blumeria graminis f. sp. tritici 96224]
MTGQPNLFAFSDADSLATSLRTYIIQCQNAGLRRHQCFKIAVSGGSLPQMLAKAILAPPTTSADTVAFSKWEIFLLMSVPCPSTTLTQTMVY